MGFQLLNPNYPGCGCTSNPSRLTCTECGSEKNSVACAKCGHDEVYSWIKTEPSVLKVDAICDKCKSYPFFCPPPLDILSVRVSIGGKGECPEARILLLIPRR